MLKTCSCESDAGTFKGCDRQVAHWPECGVFGYLEFSGTSHSAHGLDSGCLVSMLMPRVAQMERQTVLFPLLACREVSRVLSTAQSKCHAY